MTTSTRACGGLCGCDGTLTCSCLCHERFPEPVHPTLYAEVRERARRHAAERLAAENADAEYVDYEPKCDVCGERGTDNQQVVDLYDHGTSVALAHWDGCRQRLPAWASDFD